MSKRLIVCCDGTWNTADAPAPTNVTKVALMVAPQGGDGVEQRVFYHPGVGTRRWERLRGGIFGFGLSRNIRDTYRFLMQNFDPGDELYFIGFSRGAFTARSTAGLVRNCGILRRESAERVDEAYRLYRNRSNTTHPSSVAATLFRRTYSHETPIRFIGVWDTVGALGIPLTGSPLVNLVNRRDRFHDTDLSDSVAAAFQALAIDEQRNAFRPTLWRTHPGAPRGQIVEQVWFAGVHSDVGGGYPEHALSDIALLWLVDRARSCGLSFEPEAFTQSTAGQPALFARAATDPDPLSRPHDSRRGVYRLIRPYLRPIGVTDAATEYAASTAVELYQRMPWYRPSGLTSYLDGEPRIMPIDLPS